MANTLSTRSVDTIDLREAQKLADGLLMENPSYQCRVLPDGSVACMFDLIFTRSIALGCSMDTYKARYCFDDLDLAARQYAALRSKDDVPDGWIAKRGVE